MKNKRLDPNGGIATKLINKHLLSAIVNILIKAKTAKAKKGRLILTDKVPLKGYVTPLPGVCFGNSVIVGMEERPMCKCVVFELRAYII